MDSGLWGRCDRALDWVATASHTPLSRKTLALLSTLAGGAMTIGIVAAIDLTLPVELMLALFYLPPTMAVAWLAGGGWGVVLSLICAVVWFVDDIAAHGYLPWLSSYWNVAVQLLTFWVVIGLLSALKMAYNRERTLARTDALTGAANRRYFFENLEHECDRARTFGYPMTLAYVDLDNFKQINDQHGHEQGDTLLRLSVQVMRQHLRNTDFVARVGGDEFAIVLSGANLMQARSRLRQMHTALMRLADELSVSGEFGYSLGAATFANPPSPEAMLAQSDRIMYTAKLNGKGRAIVVSAPD